MKYKKYAIDLFSGAGGLSSGLKKAGITVKAAVEIWEPAIKTYEKNIGDIVINKDITNVTSEEVLKKAGLKEGELFLLAGCPPCQGFSKVQREKKGRNDKRNMMIFEFVRFVKEIKPVFFLMENVPGMNKYPDILNEATDLIEKSGYKVKRAVLNTADYGVPQARKRLVLHGVREDIYIKMQEENIDIEFPIPMYSKYGKNNTEKWLTVRETISDLPEISNGESHKDIPNHVCANLSEINIERMKYIRKGDGTRKSLPEELILPCHKKNPKAFTNVYGIMEWDKPAPTMTGGCLTFSKGKYGHPEQMRAISAREAARIQTFSDDFIFLGSLTNLGLMIGNAVPPQFAYVSAVYFLELGKKLNLL